MRYLDRFLVLQMQNQKSRPKANPPRKDGDLKARPDPKVERRRLEAAMPPDLRYVKGWSPRIPTIEEAGIIAASRAPILSRHGLADLYPNAGAVRDRFSDLIALKRAA